MSLSTALMKLPGRLNRGIDRWLTAPEVNAAGRMGLFRILYGLFLLWIGSQGYFSIMAQTPATVWRPMFFLQPLSSASVPSPAGYQLMEGLFIIAIVLLIVGYRVRLITVIVFALGLTIETFRLSYGRVEHGSIFQVFYIPLVMIFSQWGATHSLDAELMARRTGVRVSPADSSWRYIWPVRVLLFMLGVLFLSAFYWKMNGSAWQTSSHAFENFLLLENVEVTTKGGYASPLLPLLARSRLVTFVFRYATLFFEGLFITALLHPKLRNLIVSIAIIFHAINALLMYVSFSSLLIVYGLFVDWQRVYERWCPAAIRRIRLDRFSTRTLIGGTLVVALVFALLWSGTSFFRLIFSLDGLLDWRTIWLPLLPVGVIGVIRAAWILLTDGWAQLRRVRSRTIRRA